MLVSNTNHDPKYQPCANSPTPQSHKTVLGVPDRVLLACSDPATSTTLTLFPLTLNLEVINESGKNNIVLLFIVYIHFGPC